MIKLYLDCEFNGFGGELLSIAITGTSDIPDFYAELEPTEHLDPWVEQNVMPNMCGGECVIGRADLAQALGRFLRNFPQVEIVADWPDDIAYFCKALIVGPGEMVSTPSVMRLTVDRNLNSERSFTPHNALCDAMAIREMDWRR